jgi:hypothetical protein
MSSKKKKGKKKMGASKTEKKMCARLFDIKAVEANVCV